MVNKYLQMGSLTDFQTAAIALSDLPDAPADTVLGNATGSTGSPTYAQVVGAQIASDVALAGNPTTTTQATGNNTTRIATTAFVQADSVALTNALLAGLYGISTIPGVSDGTVFGNNTGGTAAPSFSQIVASQIANSTITGGKIASSVALAGSPTTTTATANDNSTKVATTAYVDQRNQTVRADSTPIAITATDNIIHYTTGTSVFSISLPTASTFPVGRILTCVKVDSGSGSMGFVGPGFTTISGIFPQVVNQWDSCQFYTDGTNWFNL